MEPRARGAGAALLYDIHEDIRPAQRARLEEALLEDDIHEDIRPAQRARLLAVDRYQLDQNVRSELISIFKLIGRTRTLEKQTSPRKPPAVKPPAVAAASTLGPLLFQQQWFILQVMSYLSPCEIQDTLCCSKPMYGLLQEEVVQERLLQIIIVTFSIFEVHANLIFHSTSSQARKKWGDFFCWLDRTMEQQPNDDSYASINCKMHRALFAEQTISDAAGKRPSFFRAFTRPETTFREECDAWLSSANTSGSDADDEDSYPDILPQFHNVTHPCHHENFCVLHGDFNLWSYVLDFNLWSYVVAKIEQNQADDDDDDVEEKEIDLPLSNLRTYTPVLRAADLSGHRLNVFLKAGQTFYQYFGIDESEDREEGDPLALEFESLGEMLCNVKHEFIGYEKPILDHQLCMLAWLVAHRFPPFDSSEGLLRAKELLFPSRELSSLLWDDIDKFCGKVSSQTVSFLEDAIEGVFGLAKASAYS